MAFTELIDLASEKLGGAVLIANDDFFAPKENLLKASTPIAASGWTDGRAADGVHLVSIGASSDSVCPA